MGFLILLIHFTPFWALPVMFISLQMGVIYKKRSKKFLFKMAVNSFILATLFLTFYIYYGGPSGAVQKMLEIVSYLEN
jgi:dolichyl-phosphate-mannose--protein O-mannosyl transferase